MMILALLANAAAAYAIGTSELADPGHTHKWSEAVIDDEGIGWIDENWTESIFSNGEEYPSVLIRFTAELEEDVTTIGDILLAVSCDRKEMGAVAGWLREGPNGEMTRRETKTVEFDFASPPFDENDIAIFKAACGEDWTP